MFASTSRAKLSLIVGRNASRIQKFSVRIPTKIQTLKSKVAEASFKSILSSWWIVRWEASKVGWRKMKKSAPKKPPKNGKKSPKMLPKMLFFLRNIFLRKIFRFFAIGVSARFRFWNESKKSIFISFFCDLSSSSSLFGPELMIRYNLEFWKYQGASRYQELDLPPIR